MLKLLKKILKGLLTLTTLGVLLIITINGYIVLSSKDYVVKDETQLSNAPVAIILGASVHGNNLSLILEDRVKEGIKLYENGKVDKLLLSGDHGAVDYDEVNSMRLYILNQSSMVSPTDLFMDHAGFDTYDSMYRAKEIYGVDQMIIVTQSFHINRAVYIARSLGMNAIGLAVDDSKYNLGLRAKWEFREVFSRIKAFLDVTFHAEPAYLGDAYNINGDGQSTWDVKIEP